MPNLRNYPIYASRLDAICLALVLLAAVVGDLAGVAL
jgi:hypothetical protein